MKKDIENRNDIELLVDRFYEKVLSDQQLGLIFRETANNNWSTHLQVMYNFWENIILFTGTYEGNPMNLHQHLHHLQPLNAAHFDQWNQLFEGEKADLAKQRAISISEIIKKKILGYYKQEVKKKH
jgi:hemoglobin